MDLLGPAKRSLLEEGVVTVKEAATFMGVTTRTIWNLMDRGELPWTKVGTARRIPRKAVIAMLSKNLQGPI